MAALESWVLMPSPSTLRRFRALLPGALLLAATVAARAPKPVHTAADTLAVPTVAACEPLDASTLDPPIGLRSTVGIDVDNTALAQPLDAYVHACLLVDSTGVVREASAVARSDSTLPARLTAAALESARWWLFSRPLRGGHPATARVLVNVPVHVPVDADPLSPDVVAMAAESEARGDLRGAIDAWTGALARVGQHPALRNEWAIRARVIGLAARMPKPPEVPMMTEITARSMHNLMERNMARASNADYADKLDGVLRDAPWYADAYRWRASARAASGQRDGAIRDVLCYRLAVHDSAGRALATRALMALAADDTLAALTMLKN